MFGRQHQLAMMASQVEKRIDPGVKIGGAAQTVTGATIGGHIFSCMVDQGDRRAGLALKNAKVLSAVVAGSLSRQRKRLNHRLSFLKDGDHPTQNLQIVCCGALWQELLDPE